MAKKIILGFYIVLIILTVFFFRSLYCQSWYTTFKFSNEIVPFDVFNLLFSSGITVGLAFYITKKFTEQRYEKELIIADLKAIESQVIVIEKSIAVNNSIDLQIIIENLSILRRQIDRFYTTIEIFSVQKKFQSQLNAFYNILYTQATNIDGSKLEIDFLKRRHVSETCSDFIRESRSLICDINKR